MYEKFTPEFFDHPTLFAFYNWYLDLTCGISCLLYCLIIYIELKAATLSKSPAMSALFAVERSIVGFETPSGNGNWWFDFASTALVIVLVFGVVLLIGLNVGCFVLIRKRREMMSRKTYQMNITLYKVLTLQMTTMVSMLVMPAAILAVAIQMRSLWANELMIICFSISSTHAIVEFVVTAYFIKLYRRFFTDHLDNLLSKLFHVERKERAITTFWIRSRSSLSKF
ncbi:serpentine type 7TM GPCR chemoreceptor srh domain-containing protein [Ditylenchus destructor]|uniref:Serpentine type 7TM GPCR chemoreceptor srh domain-containing protein n=1 Tax=Ditylenchus destructor TaxID=166010 RepID=A0AAD4MT98_9BILA|nr:serpentine type 7TM GPCR chemoreceptor srh domain-containing protein [Ditylenchus destructor]